MQPPTSPFQKNLLQSNQLQEVALVTKTQGNIAWVSTRSKLSCSSCQVKSTCGQGILEKYLADKSFITEINNVLSAKVGEQVIISIPKVIVTKAALLVYGFPLLGLFLGALIGYYLFVEEVSILMGVLGLISGFFLAKLISKQTIKTKQYEPKMLSIIDLIDNSSQLNDSRTDNISIKNI